MNFQFLEGITFSFWGASVIHLFTWNQISTLHKALNSIVSAPKNATILKIEDSFKISFLLGHQESFSESSFSFFSIRALQLSRLLLQPETKKYDSWHKKESKNNFVAKQLSLEKNFSLTFQHGIKRLCESSQALVDRQTNLVNVIHLKVCYFLMLKMRKY